MRDFLPEYAAGSLDPENKAQVEAHLPHCPTCRADLAAWQALTSNEVPPADLISQVLIRSALTPVTPTQRRRVFTLLAKELRLVRPSLLAASAIVLGIGVLLTTAQADGLTLIAPIVAAVGVGAVAGPHRDPAYELIATTPTSPRLIILARLTLIFGYDLTLALAATALPARPLITTWLGPMALLSALTLLLAVLAGTEVAIGAALLLWSLRVLAGSAFAHAAGLPALIRATWATNPTTLTAALALAAAAAIAAGREPLRRPRATHLA